MAELYSVSAFTDSLKEELTNHVAGFRHMSHAEQQQILYLASKETSAVVQKLLNNFEVASSGRKMLEDHGTPIQDSE